MQDLPAEPTSEPEKNQALTQEARHKAQQNVFNDADLSEGVSLDEVEAITTGSTLRLDQRRASYQVLNYCCPMIRSGAGRAV